MKQRILSLLLAAALLIGMVPAFPRAATGIYTWIKDPALVSGSQYATNPDLAAKLDQIFNGNASIYYNVKCTDLVDTKLGTSRMKNNNVYMYVGPNGGMPHDSGTSCWIYGNGVYYTLFGECCGAGSAGKNSVSLSLRGTYSKYASYENFKAWGVRQGPGAFIRANGHTMIVLNYDEEQLTILDGNGDSNGLVSIRVRSWDQVNFPVSYIIQPKDEFYYDLYPLCNHEYSNLGVCGLCQLTFNYQRTYETNCTALYTYTGADPFPRPLPYTDAEHLPAALSALEPIEVFGSVTNAFNETWYQIDVNGSAAYVSAENLSFSGYSGQDIVCELTSPAEGAIVPKASYPVTGTVVSNKYPLQEVTAYIDGKQYTTVTLGEDHTLNIQPSSINQVLSFSSLSCGYHTLTIKARDIHHSELETVCTRRFITVKIVDCDHLYSITDTKAPGCGTDGAVTYTCNMCGDIYIESTPATQAHTYDETAQPTCTEAVVCENCKATVIPALGHRKTNHPGKAPTCTESGWADYVTCSGCDLNTYEALEPAGHSFEDEICTTCGLVTGDNSLVEVLANGTHHSSYASFTCALTAAQSLETPVLRLHGDVQTDAVVEGDLWVDLNGYDLEGLSVTGSVFGLDSTTDSYSADQAGSLVLSAGNVSGDVKTTEAQIGAIRRYLAIPAPDGSYSFHRFYFGITHIVLTPEAGGIGYKATFAGDEAVRSYVSDFGIKLDIDKTMASASEARFSDFNGKVITRSLLLQDVFRENLSDEMLAQRANTNVYASTFLTTADGHTVTSSVTGNSLRPMIEAIDQNWASIDASDKYALVTFYNKYRSLLESWELPNMRKTG